MSSRFTIVGLGEALFDVLPDAQHLGGAPLNAAIHAHQLAQKRSGRGVAVSRVGQDALASQVIDALKQRGMDASYVQSDPDYDTGKVYVDLDDQGQPSYDIVSNVAWDVLQFDPDLEDLAKRCEAVTFGTLAQRHPQSRTTIHRFLATATRAIRLFDVNLRQDFFDESILRRSCENANVLKLNQAELPVVLQTLGMDSQADEQEQIQSLFRRFQFRMIALTRGSQGTVLYTPHERVEGPPVSYPSDPQADAIGAGDACTAGLLVGLVLRLPPSRLVNLANHMGAFVASRPGATPELPAEILELL
jgi:fructokinase